MNHRSLETIIKGFANHYRLRVLELLRREPGLSVDQLAERLGAGYINTSDHVRKMSIAGLVRKRNESSSVHHTLTPRGLIVLEFCKKLK